MTIDDDGDDDEPILQLGRYFLRARRRCKMHVLYVIEF